MEPSKWFTKSPGAILDMRSMARRATGRIARRKSSLIKVHKIVRKPLSHIHVLHGTGASPHNTILDMRSMARRIINQKPDPDNCSFLVPKTRGSNSVFGK